MKKGRPQRKTVASKQITVSFYGKKVLIPGIGFVAVFVTIIILCQARPFSKPPGEGQNVLFQKPQIDPNRIAVAVFENKTGNPDLDHLGRMTRDWITLGLQKTGDISVAGQVPENKSAGREEEVDLVRWISHETYAGKVVTGAYYLQDETLRIHAELHDAIEGKLLHAIKSVSGSPENPMVSIEALRRRVMRQLTPLGEYTWQSCGLVETNLPDHEAYREFTEGNRLFSGAEYNQAIEHYKKSFSLDPDFPLPLFWWFFTLTQTGDRADAEPVLKKLEQNVDKLFPLHRFLLDYAKASLHGRWADGHKAIRQAARLDKAWSYLYGTTSIIINRPGEAVAAIETLDPERGGMRGRTSYWNQLTLAYHMLGDHKQELEKARQARQQYPDDLSVLWYEVRAWAASGKIKEVNKLIDESFDLPPANGFNPGVIMLNAWMELNHQGHIGTSREMLYRSLDWHRDRPQKEVETISFRYSSARVFYYSGMWEKAKSLYAALHRENPENVRYHGWLGSTLARMGDKEGALNISKELAELDRPDLLGHHLFRCARIAAVLGEKETAMNLIREALAQGYSFTKLHPSNDFEALWDYPPFQELIKPRG